MSLKIGGDLKSDAGLKKLNDHLESRSYIEGYTASQSDVVLIDAVGSVDSKKFPHVSRWQTHIKSFNTNERKAFTGVKKSLADFGVTAGGAASKPAAEDNDDDFELFGSDDEVDEEAEKAKAARVAAYNEKKSKKAALIAKSNVILDVKPWDDETDMKKLEECVRTIQTEGLVWGASKLVPLAYGIHKLTIVCVVEDDKVSIDWLTEEIEKFEDYVQSVDIAAFQKI
ncbi:elongation factor 1-beta-like [Oppia nitens]|uniref:elongation factor 1-beta-like n=1 Tax=Oppia nitens TaxID=1686743 RepID=UPI0023D9A3AC|nr:elongation factor 1-beta-like [Oppia nitens]